MEEVSVQKRQGTIANKKVRKNLNGPKVSPETTSNNMVSDKLVDEVDKNFLDYLNCHGLTNEDNLLILSSNRHYYYDYEELKEVTTLINLKKLNLVKHLDDFLQTIYNGLSPKTNFIGCFTDTRAQKEESLTTRLYKKIINFLDSKIYMEINSDNFSRLLESHGFRIIDMREINGLTYFRTQN